MMVTFVSQCEKKALARSRRVLDAFADRIGDNTWQTVITEDGLVVVKKLLRQSVTKNTAVSCHWIRSRSRSELLWIVGNRNKFNSQGLVPVNATQKSIAQNKWENDWHYLPLIKALVAVAALLHDWGKASVLFQKKLSGNEPKGDPLRHEWISCLLLNALVQQSGNHTSDEAWLNLLISAQWHEADLQQQFLNCTDQVRALSQLPPLAQMVAWLIVSHHRLPTLKKSDQNHDRSTPHLNDYADISRHDLSSLLSSIGAAWGYQNKHDQDDYHNRLKHCFEFQHGLLSDSNPWCKNLKKWAARLKQEMVSAEQCLSDGCWRVVLHHARLCLMLGDHYYSSCNADANWKTSLPLIANTDKSGAAKQKLDEHLVHVSQNALQVAQSLSRLAEEMQYAQDLHKLKKKSPQGFEWQDQAVKTIRNYVKNEPNLANQGCFVVNMASTGKGKTIANAKIMQALSLDAQSLRYVLALGLRTLTLQTGDSYTQDIGLASDELAVLIGSKAVLELHQNQQLSHETELQAEDLGSESLEQLLDNDVIYENMPQADFMDALFPKDKAEKNKAFLFKPVLVCTIDHIIAATECKRGGKYILPSLRLLSSDLVIDEVDDFSGQDLIAIARLVHLAAMLGRKVMISSATIPPALAQGFFNAYQLGWKTYCQFKRQKNVDPMVMWVDEFKSQLTTIDLKNPQNALEQYHQLHNKFISQRVTALQQQIVKHKAYIVPCADLVAEKEIKKLDESLQNQYFEKIQQQAIHLHQQHHTIDVKTGKKVSFGVIRVANIPPCVALTRFLLNTDWPEHIAPRVMAYHSRQVLLLRSEQERHLDTVLKRKEKPNEQPKAFSHPIIRKHIDQCAAQDVIFILVATPVEEVGRDHDFDWAIVEPSSYRSIIQLAGRVLRHRKREQDITTANIALMQFNLRAIRKAKVAFTRPGFEKDVPRFRLESKDLKQLLVSENEFTLNAIPRIQANKKLSPKTKLADLEHAVIANQLINFEQEGANSLNGWLSETWHLTALPQTFNPFRESSPSIQLYAVVRDSKISFCERDDYGHYVNRTAMYNIHSIELNPIEKQRLWLSRDYLSILRDKSSRVAVASDVEIIDIEQQIEKLSKRYGELMLPQFLEGKKLVYSDQFGLVVLEQL